MAYVLQNVFDKLEIIPDAGDAQSR